jgi:hypothetical protein
VDAEPENKENRMKKLMTAVATFAFATAVSFAAEKTITGEGMCAKCELKEAKSCQNAIKADGVTYYLADNKTSKDFHSNLCSKTAKVKATGEVSEKDGKKILTASKIELAK